jgi:hypothetical protein
MGACVCAFFYMKCFFFYLEINNRLFCCFPFSMKLNSPSYFTFGKKVQKCIFLKHYNQMKTKVN